MQYIVCWWEYNDNGRTAKHERVITDKQWQTKPKTTIEKILKKIVGKIDFAGIPYKNCLF